MAIWRGKSGVPTTGPKVHIHHKPLSGADRYHGDATAAVGLARDMMQTVLTALGQGASSLSDVRKAALDYYFVLGGSAVDSASFKAIYDTLTLVSGGINSAGVSVKVTMAGDAMGYVNLYRNKKAKSGWTAGKSKTGDAVHRGAIHIDSDRLDTGPLLSAKTFIHEASHKYGSLSDFGEKGYTDDTTGQFRAAGLTAAEALNNAESYARFVMAAYVEG